MNNIDNEINKFKDFITNLQLKVLKPIYDKRKQENIEIGLCDEGNDCVWDGWWKIISIYQDKSDYNSFKFNIIWYGFGYFLTNKDRHLNYKDRKSFNNNLILKPIKDYIKDNNLSLEVLDFDSTEYRGQVNIKQDTNYKYQLSLFQQELEH